MNHFKEKCIELRKLDYTLLEIVKITGRPKTSIYPYIKNIPLSSEKQFLIKVNSGKRISSISTARKGRSAREFKKIKRWNKNLVRLVAHFIFDGEIRRTGCIYNNRNNSLINTVKNAMKEIYDFKPIKYLNPITGVSRISYFNVELASHIKEKSIELVDSVEKMAMPLKRQFLVAFFDDEGCVDFRPFRNLRGIRGYQKSVPILILVQKLLNNFGIVSKIQKPNEVVIRGKENLLKFQNEINFSPGIYINGKRSNSIWKKHLQKRDLLTKAIRSFKT